VEWCSPARKQKSMSSKVRGSEKPISLEEVMRFESRGRKRDVTSLFCRRNRYSRRF
jgi:hypothetical protein